MQKKYTLALILILGLFLRFYHNTLISLWHDEAFSALMIRYSWSEMFYRLGLDVHPPMYYVFLRFWHYIFGDSLLSLRGMSIFFGTASVWAAWAFVKEAFKNEKAALLAALLIAINPFQLQYVTEARMYTMGGFFALLAAYFLVKALGLQKKIHDSAVLNMPNLPEDIKLGRQMWLAYAGFAASMAVMLYTHYYLFFTAAAIGLYGLLFLFFHHKWDWKKYLPFAGSCLLAAASFLPWLKTFLFQYRQVQQGYWIPPMDAWSIPSTFWDMLLGFSRDLSSGYTKAWIAAVTALSIFILFRFVKRAGSFHKWLVVLCVLAPFGGAMLFAFLSKLKGSSSSVYMDRYFLFASVFFSVAVADWLGEINSKRWFYGLLIFYAGLNLAAYVHYWSQLDVKSRPGMSAAAEYLLENSEPGQKIIAGTSFMFFNLKYYLTTPAATGISYVRAPLFYSGGRTELSQILHFEGSALFEQKDLLPDFKTAAHSGDTVWLVWTNGFGSGKPGVPANWVRIDEKAYAEVRPYVGTWVYVDEFKVN